MYYLGIDLHKDESHVAVLDDDAEVVEEIRVTNANLDEVAEEYAGAALLKSSESDMFASPCGQYNVSPGSHHSHDHYPNCSTHSQEKSIFVEIRSVRKLAVRPITAG